jgi:hypothetical protein
VDFECADFGCADVQMCRCADFGCADFGCADVRMCGCADVRISDVRILDVRILDVRILMRLVAFDSSTVWMQRVNGYRKCVADKVSQSLRSPKCRGRHFEMT